MKNNSKNVKVEPARLGLGEYLLIGAGVLVIALGVYGLLRPNLVMPAKRETLQINGQQVVMETRRVIPLPRPLSAVIIVCGAGLILVGISKH